ncbi:MAG: Uma2 family endonuclease [Trichocoleus desertorum ATA4-8-CV12]|jgi:Uma2 family endonuclease|nr:Uma2 family endonuclease [Trichocoleus desertorum ATA4-8-CV12]
MSSSSVTSEQRVVLDKISWQKFENILAELGADRTTRFAYHRGRMEMMNPHEEHERYRKLIESLLLVLADETYLKLVGFSSALLQQPEVQCAIEPNACFYISHAPQMLGKTNLDLSHDPVPDLVLDITFTSSTLDKLPIYAALGIPEVWCYTSNSDPVPEQQLTIYQLQNQQYFVSETSLAFNFLPAARVLEFIEQSDSLGLVQSLQLLRAWVQERI